LKLLVAISVTLHGGLIPPGTAPAGTAPAGRAPAGRAPAGAREIDLKIPSDESVRGVVERLGIPEASVRLAFVGKERVTMDYHLKDGDRLNLFPAMAGG
jgi:molybdopterin converting factor small subunit